jgi:multidrug efflux system membrane fusion protein
MFFGRLPSKLKYLIGITIRYLRRFADIIILGFLLGLIMLAPVSGLSRGQKWLFATVAVIALLLLWFFVWRTPAQNLPPPPNPWMQPVPVRTAPATRDDLKVHIKAIGSVVPLNTVTVRSRVDGPLLRVLFDEGQEVKAGDLLAEIDPAPYRVRLRQAEGTLQETRAQLANTESDLLLYQRLYTQKSIPKQQLDTQVSLVEQLKGTLKNHQAQVDDAKLLESYTRIEAPITGRLGLRQIDVGNLVSTGDTNGLVTITQTQPIAVSFTIPENQLVAVRAAYRQAGENQSALSVEAWDRSERQQLASGELTTLDNQIDITTGTLRLKAQFDNADDSLFPNQFVNARLHLKTLENVITIPADAVQYGSKGTYVYVIEDGKARMRMLELGPVEGDRIAVLEGLNDGESVVLEGLDRLTEGREAKVVNDATDAAQ